MPFFSLNIFVWENIHLSQKYVICNSVQWVYDTWSMFPLDFKSVHILTLVQTTMARVLAHTEKSPTELAWGHGGWPHLRELQKSPPKLPGCW